MWYACPRYAGAKVIIFGEQNDSVMSTVCKWVRAHGRGARVTRMPAGAHYADEDPHMCINTARACSAFCMHAFSASSTDTTTAHLNYDATFESGDFVVRVCVPVYLRSRFVVTYGHGEMCYTWPHHISFIHEVRRQAPSTALSRHFHKRLIDACPACVTVAINTRAEGKRTDVARVERILIKTGSTVSLQELRASRASAVVVYAPDVGRSALEGIPTTCLPFAAPLHTSSVCVYRHRDAAVDLLSQSQSAIAVFAERICGAACVDAVVSSAQRHGLAIIRDARAHELNARGCRAVLHILPRQCLAPTPVGHCTVQQDVIQTAGDHDAGIYVYCPDGADPALWSEQNVVDMEALMRHIASCPQALATTAYGDPCLGYYSSHGVRTLMRKTAGFCTVPWFKHVDPLVGCRTRGMPVAIINLASRRDRAEHCKHALEDECGFRDVFRLSAIEPGEDAALLSVTRHVAHAVCASDIKVTAPELACAASHVRLWTKIAQWSDDEDCCKTGAGREWFLVCEDDVQVSPGIDPTCVQHLMRYACDAVSSRFPSVMWISFSTNPASQWVASCWDDCLLPHSTWGTTCYAITAEGARFLLRHAKLGTLGVDAEMMVLSRWYLHTRRMPCAVEMWPFAFSSDCLGVFAQNPRESDINAHRIQVDWPRTTRVAMLARMRELRANSATLSERADESQMHAAVFTNRCREV